MPRPGLITRRGALRLLGAGAALVVPFGAVARPVGAGQLLLAYAPAVTPAAPTPTAGVTPAEATQRPVVTPASAPAPALGVVDERRRGQVVVDGANLRSGPSTRAPIVGQVAMGTPLAVSGWVAGDDVAPDNPTWAQLDDQTFIYSAELRAGDLPGPPPAPPDAPTAARWIDVNLTQQVVVAYAGRTAVHMARTSTGRPGWETTPGVYAIQRRVASETMTSSSLLGQDAQRAIVLGVLLVALSFRLRGMAHRHPGHATACAWRAAS